MGPYAAPMSTDTLISVQDLQKTYKKRPFSRGFRALDGISLEVGRGSVFGLLGPNGAGKTTLVKILLGLVRKTRGQALIFGEPAGRARSRDRVGYLPEAHRLPQYLTGRQILILFGMMCGRSRAELEERAPQLIEQVDMTRDADRKVREYSKGMQQRIGLAQALIHEPDIVFLDEPTDGVDPIGRAAIRNVVQELSDRGTTVFINSHLLMEVELICDHVVIMNRGRIVRQGSIDELTPRTGAVEFELAEVPADLVRTLDGVGANFAPNDRGFELAVTDDELDVVVDRLRAAGVSIRGLVRRRLNLEQAFIDTVQGEQR